MSCIVAFGGGGGGHNFLQKNLSTLTIIIIIIYIYTKRWRKIKKIVTWSIHMWNLLRSRSLLLCDWIVFTHQQAGVSKKKCRGQLLRLGATFFSRPTIMFCRSFFFSYFVISLFSFVQRMHAKIQTTTRRREHRMVDDDDEWTRNGNGGLNSGLQHGWSTSTFPRGNYHTRFFVSLPFSMDFFTRVLIEKRAIKSLE